MAQLQDFISHIRETGLPLGSHYLVEFNRGEDQSVQMLVDQVNMPGINIMTTEMRTFGEIIESAYGITYNPVTVSVLVDNNGNAIKFFHDWVNSVYDRDTRYVGYKSDYVADITITFQDRNDGTVYKVILEGAYPKTVGDVQLDHSSRDVVRLSVTFVYDRWSKQDGEAAAIDGQRSINPDLVNSDSAMPDILSIINSDNPYMPDNLQFNDGRYSNAYIDNQVGLRDWGDVESTPTQYTSYGNEMASSLGRSIANVNRSMYNSAGAPLPIIGASGANKHAELKSSLDTLTSNFVGMGEGLRDLGRSVQNVTAPAAAIANSVSAVSGTLGAIDSTMNALGMGTPFSKIRSNLTATAGKLSTVSRLKDVPGHLGTIGANMGAMGGTFKGISTSIDKATNAPAQMATALNKLGFNFERQGQNMSNGASNLSNYAEVYET